MRLTPSGKMLMIWDCNTAANVDRVERREVGGDGLLRDVLFFVEAQLTAGIDLFQG
jgi:hypothetical protein